MNHHPTKSRNYLPSTSRSSDDFYHHVISTSYLVDVALHVVKSSAITQLATSDLETELSKIEDHLLKVRFYLKGAEVKRKLALRLSPGGYQLVVNGISYQAKNLKVMVLKGEEGVVSLNSILEAGPPKNSRSPQPLDTSAMTLFDARDIDHDEAGQSGDEVKLSSRSRDLEVKSVHEQYMRILQAYHHACDLLISWVGEPARQPNLNLVEWREGLEILEVTLSEQSRELKRLQRELDRCGVFLTSDYNLNAPDAQRSQREDLISSSLSSPLVSRSGDAGLQAKSTVNPQRAQVYLEVDRGGDYQVEVSYEVQAATWEPVYQARLTDAFFDLAGTKPRAEVSVNLEMSARFAQATCEIWQHIEGEFCLYPTPRINFPALSYPSYEHFSFSPLHDDLFESQGRRLSKLLSQSTSESLSSPTDRARSVEPDWSLLLHNPLAPLTHLFSDQATMWLTLELELSAPQPRIEVMARGKLDTLLPLAGGSIHRFVAEEWLGVNPLDPLALNEELNLNFGVFPALQSKVTLIPPQASDEPSDSDESSSESSDLDLEELHISLHNTDDQVRTLLIWQDLEHGVLVNDDPQRSPRSAPVGWVLSADRKRLTRWVSLPPQRQERLKLSRRRTDQVKPDVKVPKK